MAERDGSEPLGDQKEVKFVKKARRTRQKLPNGSKFNLSEQPGDDAAGGLIKLGDANSASAIQNNELVMAAYMGFRSIAQLRLFLMHPIVILFSMSCNTIKVKDYKQVFENLRTPDLEENLTVPEDEEVWAYALRTKIASGTPEERHALFAGILKHFKAHLDNEESVPEEQYPQFFERMTTRFMTNNPVKLPAFVFPVVGRHEIQYPQLGPHPREPYNEPYRRLTHLALFFKKHVLSEWEQNFASWLPDSTEEKKAWIITSGTTPEQQAMIIKTARSNHLSATWIRPGPNDKAVTPECLPLWLRPEVEALNIYDVDVAPHKRTIIECIQTLVRSTFPQDPTVEELQLSLQTNTASKASDSSERCMNMLAVGSFTILDTTIESFESPEVLVDFLAERMSLTRSRLFINRLWYAVTGSHHLHPDPAQLRGKSGSTQIITRQNRMVPIFSSDKTVSVHWGTAVSKARETESLDQSLSFTLAIAPEGADYPYRAHKDDLDGIDQFPSRNLSGQPTSVLKRKTSNALDNHQATYELSKENTALRMRALVKEAEKLRDHIVRESETVRHPPFGEYITKPGKLGYTEEELRTWYSVPGSNVEYNKTTDHQVNMINAVLDSCRHEESRTLTDRNGRISRNDEMEGLRRSNVESSLQQESVISDDVDDLISSSPASIGPPLEICQQYLYAKIVPDDGKHSKSDLPRYQSPLATSQLPMMAHQLTGAVHVILRTLDFVLTFNAPPGATEDEKSSHKEAAQWLHEHYHLPMRGVIIADRTGLGKTLMSLWGIDLAFLAMDEDGSGDRLPSVVLTPDHVVAKQWVDDIRRQYPDWHVITEYGISDDRTHLLTKAAQWKGDWPENLDWVWEKQITPDGRDPRRTIIITTMHNWAIRTRTDNDKSLWEVLDRCIEYLVLDEIHRIKAKKGVWHKGALSAPTNRVVGLSSTPCINVATEYSVLSAPIWKARKKCLTEDDRDMMKFLEDSGFEHFSSILNTLGPEAKKTAHSFVSRPQIVRALLQYGKFSRFAEGLILRRGGHTTLYRHCDRRGPVSMASVIPPLRASSVGLQFEPEMRCRVEKEMLFWLIETEKKFHAWRQERRPKDKTRPPPHVRREYGYMSKLATSFPVYRMTRLLESVDFPPTAPNVLRMRKAGIDIRHLARVCLDLRDNKPANLFQCVLILCRGSPQLLELLRTIRDKLLCLTKSSQEAKILVTVDDHFVAFVGEIVLKALRVPTGVRYGSMQHEAVVDIMESFRSTKEDTIRVFFQTYKVGKEGVNLDGPCRYVFVWEPAWTGANEDQAAARVHRATTKHEIHVTRAYTIGTIHEYLHFKQKMKRAEDLKARFTPEQSRVYLAAMHFLSQELVEVLQTPLARDVIQSRSVSIPVPMPRSSENSETSNATVPIKRRKVTFGESAEQAYEVSLKAPAAFKSESQPAIRTLRPPNHVEGFDSLDTFEQSRIRYCRLDISAKLLFSMDREFARHAHAIQNAAVDEVNMRSNEALMQHAFECVDTIKSGLPVSSRRFFAYANFDHLSIEHFAEATQELKQAGIQAKEMDLYWDINLDDPSTAHDDDDDEDATSVVVAIPDSPEAPESTESSRTSSTATSRHSDIAKPPPPAKASPPRSIKSTRDKWVRRSAIQRADSLDIREYYPRDPDIERVWDILSTPALVNGKDFQCGIAAINISLEHQLPEVKRPTTTELQNLRDSPEFKAKLHAFDEQEKIIQQQGFYSPDVLFALLAHWGMQQNPELRFSIDCLLRDGSSRLLSGGDHPNTYHFSIYMDDYQSHYSGLKRKTA